MYLNWWEREEAQENCDHMTEQRWCECCGGFLGSYCRLCGMESDGGDHMASVDTCSCVAPCHPDFAEDREGEA